MLDLGLPDMDGKEVIEAIRRRSDVPIIVLSARDREAEKIAALDLGADDYVNKPFGIGELLARLRAALAPAAARWRRRCAPARRRRDRSRRPSRGARGEEVRLTPKEFDLLALLVRHAGRVMTHRQILTDGLGPGACDRHPVSARLHRPAAAEAGAGPDRAGADPDRARRRLSRRRRGVGVGVPCECGRHRSCRKFPPVRGGAERLDEALLVQL